MRTQRLFLTALVIATLFCDLASANTVEKSDSETFRSVLANVRATNSDLLEVAKLNIEKRRTFTCLKPIVTAAQFIQAEAFYAGTLVTLAAVIRDHADGAVVLRVLREAIPLVRSGLAAVRQDINISMGICSDNSITNVKGQALLNNLTQIDDAITSLLNRLGKSTD